MTNKIKSLALLALLAGCAKPPPPADIVSTDWTQPPPYQLHAGDELDIKFYYAPSLNEREFISPDGTLDLPLVPNPLPVSGLTLSQVNGRLKTAYAPILLRPDIEVVLRTASSDRAFVAGEVQQQGAVSLLAPATATQAVVLAQGLKPTANKSQILVIRHLSGGQVAVRVVNYNAVMSGNDSQDVDLAAGDVVYVPESTIAHIDDFVAYYIRDALPSETNFGLNYQFGQNVTGTGH